MRNNYLDYWREIKSRADVERIKHTASYYQLLGIPRSNDTKLIKTRISTLRHHITSNDEIVNSVNKSVTLALLTEIENVLTTPSKKEEYDKTLLRPSPTEARADTSYHKQTGYGAREQPTPPPLFTKNKKLHKQLLRKHKQPLF